MLDLIHEIGQTLSHNRTRTVLTGFAVAWGIFMLIILLGMAKDVRNGFEDFADDPRSRTLMLWGGYTSIPFKGYKEWRKIRLEDSDRDAVRQRNGQYIDDITATINFQTATISSDRNYLTSGPLAANVSDVNCIDKILCGRRLNALDMKEKRRVMMLEKRNAEILFGKAEEALGKSVTCMGLSWRVIGIFEHEWDTNSYIPYATARVLKGNDPQVDELKVYLKDLSTAEDAYQAGKDITATLASIHEFDPDDQGALWQWNRLENTLENRSMLEIVNIAVWIIGLMTLLSGIVGVSNIMFVSVSERSHEIGVRRAIGARPADIIRQIIFEGIAITSLFGYIGMVGGVITTETIGYFLGDKMGFTDPTADIPIALEVTLLLIICGALAALFPALKATKIKPVEALRDE